MKARRVPRASTFCAFCVSGVLCVCSPVCAQLEDKSRLIDALVEQNMPELLERLIEVDPPADPVEAQWVRIAQHRLRYGDRSLDEAARIAAFDRALQAMRELIEQHDGHELRPMWQTDLAAMLLDEHLGVIHRVADLFYEFGVPTAEQRDAFERDVIEAHRLLVSANRRFFQLRGELPRQPDHVEKRVNTGLWQRMIEVYYLKRTQFYFARAAYLVTLLLDDHAYPASLSGGRSGLYGEALNALENVGASLADDPATADATRALAGRIRLRRGDLADAERDLEAVAQRGDRAHLAARLGRIAVTAERSGPPAAVAELAQLDAHPLVAGNLLYRLLRTDFEHRLLLRAGESDAAYEPYLRLLADRSLSDQAEGLRQYIYQRWVEAAPLGREDALPPVVRMAIGQTLRQEAQRVRQAGDAAGAEALLERSMRINRALVDSGAGDEVRATAAYNLGLGMYLQSGGDPSAILEAAGVLVDAADRYPALPVAERAIRDAVALLRALHAQDPRPAGAEEAYRRAADVLFKYYARTPAADAERVYYAYHVLQADGDLEGAAAFYRKVPRGHEAYFDAQRELLLTLERRALDGEADRRPQIVEQLKRELARVEAETEAETSDAARSALAAARLVRAQLLHEEDRLDEALAALDGFERDFAGDSDLVRLAQERRIVMLAGANRAEPLASAARAMMDAFPDDAAAVFDRVLTRLDEQIDRQRAVLDDPAAAANRRDAAAARIDTLARTAATLADLLVQWARQRGLDDEQMVAYELIHVKVLLLGGDAARAAEIAERQLARFPDALDVLHQAGEAYYAVGDEPALIRAAQVFDRIIGGLDAPYPEAYWHAWMRRLQINDRLDRFTDQIPRTVRQLQMQDARLGGPPYSLELQRLARKYSSR